MPAPPGPQVAAQARQPKGLRGADGPLPAVANQEPASQGRPAMPSWNSGHLIEFDPPGSATRSSKVCYSSCGTQAVAINAQGAITGDYTNNYVQDFGFLREPSGQIISFSAPGAGLGHYLDQGTDPLSINDVGTIAGVFEDAKDVLHGFVRLPDGHFTTFDAPGAGNSQNQGTWAQSINNQGATTGYYLDSSNVQHGFVRSPTRDGGIITDFDPPGSIKTFVCEATCLNAKGQVAGDFEDSSQKWHGFVREPDGTITVFDFPAPLGLNGTHSRSINDHGAVTGFFYPRFHSSYKNPPIHGYLRRSNGSFVGFEAPGRPLQTVGESINGQGTIAGVFGSVGAGAHGFSRSTGGKFATFNAPGGGASTGQGTWPQANNFKGAITGYWIGSNWVNHGFVWTP